MLRHLALAVLLILVAVPSALAAYPDDVEIALDGVCVNFDVRFSDGQWEFNNGAFRLGGWGPITAMNTPGLNREECVNARRAFESVLGSLLSEDFTSAQRREYGWAAILQLAQLEGIASVESLDEIRSDYSGTTLPEDVQDRIDLVLPGGESSGSTEPIDSPSSTTTGPVEDTDCNTVQESSDRLTLFVCFADSGSNADSLTSEQTEAIESFAETAYQRALAATSGDWEGSTVNYPAAFLSHRSQERADRIYKARNVADTTSRNRVMSVRNTFGNEVRLEFLTGETSRLRPPPQLHFSYLDSPQNIVRLEIVNRERELPSTPIEDIARPEPTRPPSLAKCGAVTDNYLKLCYRPQQAEPFSPRAYEQAIREFVRRTHTRTNPGTGQDRGYMIVVGTHPEYEPDISVPLGIGTGFTLDLPSPDAKRRGEIIKTRIQQELENLRREGEFVWAQGVAYESFTFAPKAEDGSDLERRDVGLFTLVIPLGAYPELQTQYADVETERPWVTQADQLMSEGLFTTEEAQWEALVAQTMPEVQPLIEQIRRQHHIKVVPVFVPRPLANEEAVIEAAIKRYGGDELPEELKQPCTSYLVVDPLDARFYQSSYCRLQTADSDLRSTDTPRELAVEMLRSALRRTPEHNPEELLLIAHQRTLSGDTAQAQALANHIKEHHNNARDRAIVAGAEIVLIEVALEENDDSTDYEVLLSELTRHIDLASPNMKSVGLMAAVETALRFDRNARCQVVQRLIDTYSRELRGPELRRANEELQYCFEQEISQTCERMEGSDGDFLDLHIVLANDGLSEDRFDRATQAISTGLLSLAPLGDYEQQISFWKASANINYVTARDGERLIAPNSNKREMALLQTACPGDVFLILSSDFFLPVAQNNAGLITVEGCQDQTSCMTIYAARSLGELLFNLPYAQNTVMAPNIVDSRTSTVLPIFNIEQQDIIIEKMDGGYYG